MPAAVRKSLGVAEGDDVIFEERGGMVTVSPDRSPGRFAKFAGKYRAGRGRSREGTLKFVRELRGREGE